MSKSDGGSAFPWPESSYAQGNKGMSLRDYMAIHASEEDISIAIAEHSHTTSNPTPNLTQAEARYAHADAMLMARNA